MPVLKGSMMTSFAKQVLNSDRFLLTSSVLCLTAAILLLSVHGNRLRASVSEDEEFLRFVDLSAEIYTEIKGKYVDEVEAREVLEGALAGMFARLDEHSQFMDPRMLENLNKDTGGEFSGIGIHITMRQGLLTVIAPIPGSPSAQLGLAPWDRIIEIDGESTEGMTLPDAVDRLTGPKGTQVTIKVFRDTEPEPLEFTITRDTIKIDSVHYKMQDEEEGIGYLRIARFSEQTADDMQNAILDMKSQGMRALVLDLRWNTGGLLREAIDVADLFVPRNELIVSTKGRLRSNNAEYRAQEDPITDIPVFVLVNEGSASASEIVAGALQDHHLGVVVGPKGKNTFGKGSVQTIEPLQHSLEDDEDGNPKMSAIRLTTARYYTPSGRTIHHVGITPDLGIDITEEHERELLRHGLYGDTTIPMTVEEKKAREEFEQRLEEQRNGGAQGEQPNGGVEIQTRRDAEEAPEDSGTVDPVGDAEPFYSQATRPEFVEDGEFRDIMLDEAVKQLKIYLILDENRRENEARLASIAR